MTNIISTKITVFRNLKDYKFMPKLEKEKYLEIEAKVDDALKDLTKINLTSTNGNTINFLNQNNLLAPRAKAVYLTKDNVAVNLFAGEHLALIATCYNFDEKLFAKAKTVLSVIENKLSMAYNDQYGYLMSDIKNIGSGLQVESLLSLPCLVEMGKIAQVCQNMKNLGYQLEKVNGSYFKFSTVCSLGLTAEEVFTEFGKMLTKLAELEIESEKMLYATNEADVTDKVMRSYALLTGAYLVGFDELKNNLTNIRIGVNLNILDVKPKQIDAMQALVDAKIDQFVTQQEKLDLAKKVKEILK